MSQVPGSVPAPVLGVDPGSRRTGWAVVRARGLRFELLGCGVVALDGRAPLQARLLRVADRLEELLQQYRPRVLAVEDLFVSRHPRAAVVLGHVRGAVLLTAARAGLVTHAYPPALVKRAVVGRGRADKAQVARLVAALTGLAEPPPSDAADAVAVAITHLQAERAGQAGAPRPGRGGHSSSRR